MQVEVHATCGLFGLEPNDSSVVESPPQSSEPDDTPSR